MTFADLASGVPIFLDANILVYHLTAHPTLGTACTDLVKRIEQNTIHGFTSTHVLTEVAHRVMLIEASQTFGWSLTGTLKRLKQHPQEVGKLSNFRLAIQQVPKAGIQVLTIPPILVDAGAAVSQQTGLLSNDALIVAIMQHQGLRNLASHDSAFDGVAGVTRYAPN